MRICEISERETLLDDIRKLINDNDIKWKFAWTYAKRLPHEYIMNNSKYGEIEKVKRFFDLMKKAIILLGKVEQFGNWLWKYIEIDGFKFWFDSTNDENYFMILNRKWLKGYEIDFEKRTYKLRDFYE